MDDKPQIFICYAKEDRTKIEGLYQELSEKGYKPWMDEKELLPGAIWREEIQKAIRGSDFFLACISKNLVNKRGFVHREIREALEICQERLPTDIYLIPVRLEECEIPESLRYLQHVDFFDNDFLEKLEHTIGQKKKPEDLSVDLSSRKKTSQPLFHNILYDYTNSLGTFFDPETGAIYEESREDGRPKFLFTEATAFAILESILLYSLTGKSEYIEQAHKSACWIIDKAQHECGGVRTRYYFERDGDKNLSDTSFKGGRIFSFDTAICLKAIVALYSVKRDERFLESAKRMAEFFINKMIKDDGTVHAVYDSKSDRIMNSDPRRWSQQSGAFHTKVAEALIDLYTFTQEAQYRDKAESICSRAQEFQFLMGNFETSPGRTELHPHCYAAEGLLHVGRYLQNEKFIQAARRATEWALDNFQNGEIAQVFNLNTMTPSARFRTDTLAQMLALAADLFHIGQLEKDYKKKMDEIVSKILDMREDGSYFGKSPGRIFFRYGYYENNIDNRSEAKTLSYWTNMFCVQGLYKYHLAYLLERSSVVILAGGKGSRTWPISCESKPKPFSYSFLGDRSLIQETIRRYIHNSLLKPKQIFVICAEKGLLEARAQIAGEGVPGDNIIVEKKPLGNIPALSLALQCFTRNESEKRLVIVSMADNVIEPYELFQNALINALFVTSEEECIASIGKQINLKKEGNRDSRFGHISYSDENKRGIYPTYEVDRFKEKPDERELEEMSKQNNNYAWECGTILFQEQYYNKVVSSSNVGNLAENLLQKTGNKNVKMIISILDSKIRFEDFGVPGSNLHKFFKGSDKDKGNGNICLGTKLKPDIKLLCCGKNLVISDQLPIRMYGLEGYLIIDSAVTNTAVVMPLSEAKILTDFYEQLGAIRLKPFTIGGKVAAAAQPDEIVQKSPYANAKSELGLAIAFGCSENIFISRNPGRLWIHNRKYPTLEEIDFKNLYKKQEKDLRLVQHLVHVAALAESLLGGSIVLSDTARDVLKILCLYHDYGGYLSKERIQEEEKIIKRFEGISKLDRRLMDSRIIQEILQLEEGEQPTEEKAMVRLLNDSVNSAIELLRSQRKFENRDVRDIILFLLQVQDRPDLLIQFKKSFDFNKSLGSEEVDKVFAMLKTAEIFANARWLWKRKNSHENLLEFDKEDKGLLEEFPFTIAFIIRTLKKASIEPKIYINRLNEVIKDSDSPFMKIITLLQEAKPLLVCDTLYKCLICQDDPLKKMNELLTESVQTTFSDESQNFQLAQIRDLPANLKVILSTGCNNILPQSVKQTEEIIKNFFFDNRSVLESKTLEKDIATFLNKTPVAP
jgi:mannose-1-phosphate guanylyltransferase